MLTLVSHNIYVYEIDAIYIYVFYVIITHTYFAYIVYMVYIEKHTRVLYILLKTLIIIFFCPKPTFYSIYHILNIQHLQFAKFVYCQKLN